MYRCITLSLWKITVLLDLVSKGELADWGSVDTLTGPILWLCPNFLMCDLTLNLFYRIRGTSWIAADGLRGSFGWRQSTCSVLDCVAWLLACWRTVGSNGCSFGPRGSTQEGDWNWVRLIFVLLTLGCKKLNGLFRVIWSFFSPNLCFQFVLLQIWPITERNVKRFVSKLSKRIQLNTSFIRERKT